MTTPPMLMLSALLLWGWQTGIMLPAIVMGLALESSRVISTRWAFAQKEYNRIWDLCGLLFLISALYCFGTQDTENRVMEFFSGINWTERNKSMTRVFNESLYFFQWWPMIFFPFALAQAFGSRRRHPLATFLYLMRRRAKKGEVFDDPGIDSSFIYFAICLAAAAATTHRDLWFYAGFSLLCVWALWQVRSRRIPALLWGAVMVLLVVAGHRTHLRMHWLQNRVEGTLSEWLSNFSRQGGNFLKSTTGIGRIGELKLSGRIVWRLDAEGAPPGLIRDSSFVQWRTPVWNTGPSRKFESVPAEQDTTTWTLIRNTQGPRTVRLHGAMKRLMFVPLPAGAVRMRDLMVGEVARNGYGVLRVEDGPGLLEFFVDYGAPVTQDVPPDPDLDFDIPENEVGAVRTVAANLELGKLTLEQKLRAIQTFFQDDFAYGTWQEVGLRDKPKGMTPLSHFLTRKRTGHCEYFATATVLILRASGVPARYANGYSVQEADDKVPGRFILRERHAHAWALYWSEEEGRWIDFDTTPAAWESIEAKENPPSSFEGLSDFFADIKFRFSQWWWGNRDTAYQQYLAGALLLLVFFLFWRLFRRRRRAKARNRKTGTFADFDWPGLDSEFYRIDDRLHELGLERQPGEPLSFWLKRIRPLTQLPIDSLHRIVSLHYRYRFDSGHFGAADRQALREQVKKWLAVAARARGGRQLTR